MPAEQPAKRTKVFKTNIIANPGNRFIRFKNQGFGPIQALSGEIKVDHSGAEFKDLSL